MKSMNVSKLVVTLTVVAAMALVAACTTSGTSTTSAPDEFSLTETASAGTNGTPIPTESLSTESSGTSAPVATSELSTSTSGTVVGTSSASTAMPTTSAGTSTSSTAVATSKPAATGSSNGAVLNIQVLQTTNLGSFLADSKGRPLYVFNGDTTNQSTCYGACAQEWPPVLVNSGVQPILSVGVHIEMVGTIQRTDGTTQMTYNGKPLYFNAKDHATGDISGQGDDNAWFVITPEGIATTAAR